MKAAKLIIFASPLPTHQWCVSAWLLIEDQIGLSQCGLVLCKFNCTTPLPAPELLTCRASQSQCGMATGPGWTDRAGGTDPTESGQDISPAPWDFPPWIFPGTLIPPDSLNTSFPTFVTCAWTPCLDLDGKKRSSAFFRLVGIICCSSL